jgi:pyruvate/2-oxoglutarate/acetoin dehydrogenase E1 component
MNYGINGNLDDAESPPPVIQITYREAVRAAIRDAILKDDRVFLMDEDVGRYGGAFSVTKGLLQELGEDKIMAKTHRAVIIDEGWRSGSISAEISARIMEKAFYDLDAPVERICAAEAPIPYANHLEQAALPQPAAIVNTVQRMVARHG